MRILLFMSLLLAGCLRARPSCGPKILPLGPNAQHEYSFQTIELQTLGSVQKLEGEAARIYFENGIDNHSFTGSPAQPHVSSAGGVCVPDDVESAAAVNAYAQFESLYRFEREIGTASQITWPRSIGVNIHIKGRDSDAYNNAHYYGGPDAIALMPYSKSGLPLSFNQGIVAHEHYHSHFQAVVTGWMDAVFKTSTQTLNFESLFGPLGPVSAQPVRVAETSDVDLKSPAGLNNFVMRGWNEGLADLFAGIYTDNSDLFTPSLKVEGRELDGPLFTLRQAGDLAFFVDRVRAPREQVLDKMMAIAYAEGSVLARFLFQLAHEGRETPKHFLRRILDRTRLIGPALVGTYTVQPLNFATILPLLLHDYPFGKTGCRQLRIVDPAMNVKDYPACARF